MEYYILDTMDNPFLKVYFVKRSVLYSNNYGNWILGEKCKYIILINFRTLVN